MTLTNQNPAIVLGHVILSGANDDMAEAVFYGVTWPGAFFVAFHLAFLWKMSYKRDTYSYS